MHGVRRRESFDEVAELYEAARPGYPQPLIDDLLSLTAVGPKSRVLEIGPGTGQLTVPLAASGATVLGVELGSHLAEIARRKLAGCDHARVVIADFDRWSLPRTRFDLIVAATSFHWLDPDSRITRCGDALRPGGILAIVETRWGVCHEGDPFFQKSQLCYARWDPAHDPAFKPRSLDAIPSDRADLSEPRLFSEVNHRRYVCDREYTAAEYADLLGTFSNVLALSEHNREAFLACMVRLIESDFGGRVLRHDAYDMWLARRGEALTREDQT